MKKEKRVSKRVLLVVVGGVALFLAIIFLVVVYSRYESHTWAKYTARMLHLPVLVTVNPWSLLTATELQWKLQSVRQFYEVQDFSSLGMRVDFGTEDGKKRLQIRERGILNKNIEDSVIEKMAKNFGIRVTEGEVDQNVERKLHEFGSEEIVRSDLERLYGWTLEDFKREVVKPDLYKEKLMTVFELRQDKDFDKRAAQKIGEALKQLQAGEDFIETVEQYSEGSTVENGGEVGWIDMSQTEPILAEAIQGLSAGERTDIVETSIGYHIVRVEEVRKETGLTFYRVSQIMTRKEVMADWISSVIQKTKAWVWLPEYHWNSETGYVEFSNSAMTDFEEKNNIRVP